MSTLYLDCISGIAGDMTLAALIDLGADPGYIEKHLKKLPLDPFFMQIKQVVKRGISAKQLCLHVEPQPHHSRHHAHRHAADILAMIEQSELPSRVKERSRSIFSLIAEAEGKIHGISPEKVHFHEVGAMDSIIDIIGTCLALENLGIEQIFASEVPVGSGKVQMAHGLYPIPAPATAELLTGIPLASLHVNGELTTPTGAGILKALVSEFRPIGGFTIEKIGYGAGEKDFDHPNVLRALLIKDGEEKKEYDRQRETIAVLETQVDDMSGEALGYAMDQLFRAGALDVFYTPVYMKKNRPGTLITVLAPEHLAERCEDVLLRETTTLGVRRTRWTRSILRRETDRVETPYGTIAVKRAYRDGTAIRQMPEYEEVARIAREKGVPFQEVYETVIRCVHEKERT
ncbi:nickel pincer cofactor biosynthesis protein LarC [Thermoactinomyces sp. CICC 10522]|uniref:nickel pincer cofactor biosynthesis protein LarC n=1 Tax=Thermoactinomyces sp. CICC 10522 TaxID=2767427 RepID=UPI0018DDCF62|nr:nickel pincer cofactor biosynthesis protein LarC [Thermoactinomyces sp. CICC 10522]MBH8603714.1 nickel pincer cofactor biosynthesis protein LarC [Thermoactinomyces sp. CICC 10522]